MPPLTVLLLTDGKPGHYHQADGVVAAVSRMRPVETIRLPVSRRFLMPTRTLHQLLNAGVPPTAILWLGYGLHPGQLPPTADLVVSAGGETLAANAAAAKLLGARNVFCGRLRRVSPDHVSVIIVSLQCFAASPRHLVALPPTPFEVTRPHTQLTYGPNQPPRLVGLLIGGNSGDMRYRDDEWASLMRFMTEAHLNHGIRWLVTTSRRSERFVSDALAAMAADANSGIERFIDYRAAGPGTLREVLTQSDAIVCTDDSTTMISEAIGARLPVVGVAPAYVNQEEREAAYRRHLERNSWYRLQRIADLTPQSFLLALQTVIPRKNSQHDELAAAMRERLPDLFPPT